MNIQPQASTALASDEWIHANADWCQTAIDAIGIRNNVSVQLHETGGAILESYACPVGYGSHLPRASLEICSDRVAHSYSQQLQQTALSTALAATDAFSDAVQTDVASARLFSAHAPLNTAVNVDYSTAFGRRCPHPSCSSRVLFTRQCDLNKHYRTHSRRYFCRDAECRQDGDGARCGFPTIKDRNRHETMHYPTLSCQYCGRVFSRYDNLRTHCRRVHCLQ